MTNIQSNPIQRTKANTQHASSLDVTLLRTDGNLISSDTRSG